jgi:hypothetical protein
LGAPASEINGLQASLAALAAVASGSPAILLAVNVPPAHSGALVFFPSSKRLIDYWPTESFDPSLKI